MYAYSLITVALCYESTKRDITAWLSQTADQAETAVLGLLEAYDAKHEKQVECTGDIMCQRTGIRHKADCMGRVEPFSVYAKGITN